MGKKDIKIVLTGDMTEPFIRKDYDLLSKYFKVKIISSPKKIIKWAGYILKTRKLVKKCDISFSWFAGWHSFFAVFFSKIYKKKSIVIAGGYDTANLPELKYGAFSNFKEKTSAKYVFKNVDKILVVDRALEKEIIENVKTKKDKIIYLPTGYNPDFWKPSKQKKDMVLTVGGANNIKRVKIKGLETFVKSAKDFRDIEFIVIGVQGKAKETLEKIKTENVKILGYLNQKEILKYYQKAKVYCQLSIREGLPNVLCEAMLCECIPVGTDVQGIKTAIGDIGFYVSYGDLKSTTQGIKNALNSDEKTCKKAREKIKDEFTIKRREKGLKQIIEGLI